MSDYGVADGNIDGLDQQIQLAGGYVVAAAKQIEKGFSGDDNLRLGNAHSLLAIASMLYMLVRIEHTRDESPLFRMGGEN